MATTTDHEYLTIAEAAALVRVDRSTIRRWIASGKLHAIRPGEHTVRIRRSDLIDLDDSSPEIEVAVPVAQTDERVWSEPLPMEERQRRLALIEKFRRQQQELFEKYGPFEKQGWEILNEMRDERTRQLMGEE